MKKAKKAKERRFPRSRDRKDMIKNRKGGRSQLRNSSSVWLLCWFSRTSEGEGELKGRRRGGGMRREAKERQKFSYQKCQEAGPGG